MKILILEDEIPAFEKLQKYLGLALGQAWEHDWAKTVVDGKKFLSQSNYDLIFADIELLDGNVFTLFNTVKIEAPIVFCSAYNQFLMDAFRVNGIAYILKPYDKIDLENALSKYKTLFASPKASIVDQDLLLHLADLLQNERSKSKERLLIKKKEEMYLLPTTSISHITAAGVFCKIVDAHAKTHLYSESISSLFDKLDNNYFFRINRSVIINSQHIISMKKYFKNRFAIEMKGANKSFITSSAITPSFRAWLEQR